MYKGRDSFEPLPYMLHSLTIVSLSSPNSNDNQHIFSRIDFYMELLFHNEPIVEIEYLGGKLAGSSKGWVCRKQI